MKACVDELAETSAGPHAFQHKQTGAFNDDVLQNLPYYILATGWTVRGSNVGGDEIFLTRPD
jgi:hypothetical protein